MIQIEKNSCLRNIRMEIWSRVYIVQMEDVLVYKTTQVIFCMITHIHILYDHT